MKDYPPFDGDTIVPIDANKTPAAQARDWVIRLDSDEEMDAAEREALRAWMAASPQNKQALIDAAKFWSSANVLAMLSDTPHLSPIESAKKSPALRRRWVVGMAASLIAALTLVFGEFASEPNNLNERNRLVTSTGEVKKVVLADGSEILLNTDSEVETEFTDSLRKLTLKKGEAYFNVYHDPDREFRVYAKEGIVSAVGTAFSVRIDQDQLKVMVENGRVDLATRVTEEARPSDENPVARDPAQAQLLKLGSLGQGQSARFIAQGVTPELMNNADVELAVIREIPQESLSREMSWRQGYLLFSGQPLEEVILEVERYIPERIFITDPSLKGVQIGGRFKLSHLDEFFVALQKGFGISVSRSESGQIVLDKQQKA